MKYNNIRYYFVYIIRDSNEICYFDTIINTQHGREKEATIELIKAIPYIVDWFLYKEEVLKWNPLKTY